MNNQLIEVMRRAIGGAGRSRELHGSILGTGKYQEIYIDAESIFDDISSKLSIGMAQLSEEMESLEKENRQLKEELDKYRWRDAINEPPEHEDSIVLMSIGYEEIGSYCLQTETYYINGEPMPCGDVSHWTEFTEFKGKEK